jgi:hypothetical protein
MGEGASDVRSVVIDANVLVSFFIDRNDTQLDAAKALLLKAEEHELEAVVPRSSCSRSNTSFKACTARPGAAAVRRQAHR